MPRKLSTDEKVRRWLRTHPRAEQTMTRPVYRHLPGAEARPEVAFKRLPERRSEGERHAEREAFRGPGSEEQRVARMNEAREAFTGTRMSRGKGIGREPQRSRRRSGRRR